MSTKENRTRELGFLNTLRHLSSLCRRYERRSVSFLDPMAVVSDEIRIVSDASIRIFSLHMELFRYLSGSPDIATFLERLFTEYGVLEYYRLLLFKSTDIILSPNIAVFRSGEFSFVKDLLSIYERLLHYLSYNDKIQPEGRTTAGFEELQSVITDFENSFFAKYSLINNNSLIFEPVPSLRHYTNDLFHPDQFNIFDIKNRSFFYMTALKHGYTNMLVELIALQDGRFTIFKVNSGQLPDHFKSGKDLLHSLIMGNYTLLNVGRTIKYLKIEPHDLYARSFFNNGITLETKFESNNIELKFVCLDHEEWMKNWKPFFKYNFKFENLPHTDLSWETTRDNILRNSKILENRLSMSLEERTSQPRTPIRKSKAISSRMSMLLEPMDELDNIKEITSPSLGSSSLSPVNTPNCYTPVTMPQHLDQSPSELHSSRATFSAKIQNNNDSFNTNGFDISRAGSFSSRGGSTSPAAVFDSPIEFYEPKSSGSSASPTSSPPSIHVNQVSKGALSGSTNFSYSSAAAPLVLSNVSIEGTGSESDVSYVARNSVPLFEQHAARISYWDRTKWMQLGSGTSDIKVEQVATGKFILLSESSDQNNLAACISPSWKCLRPNPNDVHIKIPYSDITSIMSNTTPASIATVSIRHARSEQLIDIISRCITATTKNVSIQDTSLSAKTIAPRTSLHTPLPHREYEQSSDLRTTATDSSTSLKILLSNVRVKRHTRADGKLWESQDMGYLNIFSQENHTIGTGIVFQYERDDNDNPQLSKLDFTADLANIRRIGRTGITFPTVLEEELFEFSNKSVADRVFAQMHPQ